MNEDIKNDLREVIISIAGQGDYGHINANQMDKDNASVIEMYLEIIIRVSRGEPYTKEMVDDIQRKVAQK